MVSSPTCRFLLASALSLGSAACGATLSQTPAPEVQRAHGLLVPDPASIVRPVGEELVARAELLGVHVGQLTVRLGPFCAPPDGQDTSYIESRFQSAGMARWFRRADGHIWTRLDAETLYPRTSAFELKNGEAKRNYTLAFNDHGFHYVLDTSKGDHSEGDDTLEGPDHYYDVHSAFLLVRSWRAEPREKTYFYVVLGKAPWRVDLEFEGRQVVEHQESPTAVLKYSGTIHRIHLKPTEKYTPRHFQLLLTDDDKRLPVLFSGDAAFGSFRLLLEAQRLQTSCFE